MEELFIVFKDFIFGMESEFRGVVMKSCYSRVDIFFILEFLL